MIVSQVMLTGVVCVSPSSTLAEAAALLRHFRTPALPVCENDRLCGLLTDRDLARHAAHAPQPGPRTTVREAMTDRVAFVYDDDSVERAAEVMEQRGLYRLPVLNRDHRLVGMVAGCDLAPGGDAGFEGACSSPPLSDR